MRRKALQKQAEIRNKKIVVGFWHNWPENEWTGSGYQQGFFQEMKLTEIPLQYNVVAVAFMKVNSGSSDRIPTFKPYLGTDAEFRSEVEALKSQGRNVLISLGGADAHIELTNGDEEALAQRIIELCETYGFEGLDIDLEQAAITAGDNQTVIPEALKIVRNYYLEAGEYFIISMAPEFPYLREQSSYIPYISALEEYYDFIAPQFYNQGGDGIWVDGVGYLAQNNDEVKEDFLYYLTESIITGTRTFSRIPHDRFAIGIPTNNDAAANGYVVDPADALRALERLEEAGTPIKGLMTWSVNWDGGRTKDGQEYDWEFIKRYGHLSDLEPSGPSIPKDLTGSMVGQDTVLLIWRPSTGPNPIAHYTLYRDGIVAGTASEPPFSDQGLQPGTSYSYRISATDSLGNSSALSAPVVLTTLPADGEDKDWLPDTWYADNDRVRYQGKTYVCAMQHTSNIFWTPDKATSLWTAL